MNTPHTPFKPGCYIDGHHGHYAIPALVRFAACYGFTLGTTDAYILANYERDNHEENYPHEWLVEMADEAETWLNEHHALAGHYWYWDDGEFGLYPLPEDDA